MPVTTLHRLVQEGLLKHQKNKMKPKLNDANKLERVHFCLAEGGDNGLYSDMEDRIHIDEKWFYLTKVSSGFYAVEGEEDGQLRRGSTNKTTMPKLMFLAAIARPRHAASRNRFFDGKIGLWPLSRQVPAVRSSINRPRGTLEWKQIKQVTRAVYIYIGKSGI